MHSNSAIEEQVASTPQKPTNTIHAIWLDTGRQCTIIRPKKRFISDYYVVTFPQKHGEPSPSETSQMMELAVKQAKQMAYFKYGDEEAYTLLYSGHSSRRAKGWHLHIVLVRNRWKKAWLYLILMSKNLVQAFRLRKDDAHQTKVQYEWSEPW